MLAFAAAAGLIVVAVDNLPGCGADRDHRAAAELPAAVRSGIVRADRGGQGGRALTVSIAQFGSTRSINAGVAAGIAMHAWIRQHADLRTAGRRDQL